MLRALARTAGGRQQVSRTADRFYCGQLRELDEGGL